MGRIYPRLIFYLQQEMCFKYFFWRNALGLDEVIVA